MTNENASTKPTAFLAITLSAEAIEHSALELVSIVEDDLEEKANALASAAWVACGLSDLECLEDGPLAVAYMELSIDARNAILRSAIAALTQYL